MFWNRLKISKEVEELAKEMLTYHGEIKLRKNGDFDWNLTIFSFRKFDIFSISRKEGEVVMFGNFLHLNKREIKHLHDYATRAYIKKITFAENKKL